MKEFALQGYHSETSLRSSPSKKAYDTHHSTSFHNSIPCDFVVLNVVIMILYTVSGQVFQSHGIQWLPGVRVH